MRIKWNKTNVEEVTVIDFTEGYDPENDEKEIFFNGMTASSEEWQYWGKVIIDRFNSYEEAVKWCEEFIHTIMKDGYIDLTAWVYDSFIDLY